MNNKVRNNRLKYEYKEIQKYKQFSPERDKENPNIWFISFKGADNTLYENEIFKLKCEFNDNYVSKIFFNNILYSPLKVR